MELSEQRVVNALTKQIEAALYQVGIFHRIFARAKSGDSIKTKLKDKSAKYIEKKEKMQDYIGVRVGLYFADDQKFVNDTVRRLFTIVGEAIDPSESNLFGPTRWNLVFRLPDDLKAQLSIFDKEPLIDSTFELQIRTILSEGWHEVEHDLRYKCKEVWEGHKDLSRALNGIFASLELSDWSMLNIFDELAYRSYKSGDWSTMLRNKVRLHLNNYIVNGNIVDILNHDKEVAKALFRVKRNDLLNKLFELHHAIPLNANNIIYLLNRMSINSTPIRKLEPSLISSQYDVIF